jgi:hypothetical protein
MNSLNTLYFVIETSWLRAKDGRLIPELNETTFMHFGFSLLFIMLSFMFC